MLIQSKASIFEKVYYKKDKPEKKKEETKSIITQTPKQAENTEIDMEIEDEYEIYSMFTIALRNSWQAVTYLMIQNGYDLMIAIQVKLIG